MTSLEQRGKKLTLKLPIPANQEKHPMTMVFKKLLMAVDLANSCQSCPNILGPTLPNLLLAATSMMCAMGRAEVLILMQLLSNVMTILDSAWMTFVTRSLPIFSQTKSVRRIAGCCIRE